MTDTAAARRSLNRFATLVASLTAPLVVLWETRQGMPLWQASILALVSVAAFRGLIDILFKRIIEQPDLFNDNRPETRAEDSLARRRAYFWTKKFRLLFFYGTTVGLDMWLKGHALGNAIGWPIHSLAHIPWSTVIMLPFLFFFNFMIFMGPMMAMGISQVHGFEPGDATWGVNLDDVRGQKEAKEEIRKIITLWQAGDQFVKAGGKRERGILFLGAPGVGKTMLAKAIATGFNSPIVTIPGSGFAQTFIGLDAVLVRYLIYKAKKLARKWNGTCIVFIDEIDAVGMRRGSLGMPNISNRDAQRLDQMPGGMMGGMGQMGLNQLLVQMDGVDSPPFFRKVLTNKINLYLDAVYIVPQKIGKLKLRLPPAKPNGAEVYFIGATNVPLEALDPALVRAGRLGRHIHFRTPTKRDRMDIFDLYLGKVSHDAVLDTDAAREELARITQGYSPAEIEQACSIALTYAHHDSREKFTRADLLEAMVTVEAGTALGWGYESDEEEYSTAIHEAGHAICAYLWQDDVEATRLSILKRGQTGGHLQSVETVERFARYTHELMGRLVTILGAYAAETVVYGENTQGVGGDLQQASYLAGSMVGRWGMESPFTDAEYIKTGTRLLVAANPGDIQLGREKVKAEAAILGWAYQSALETIQANEAGLHKIAKTLVIQKEVYGDDLTKLLESCGLEKA